MKTPEANRNVEGLESPDTREEVSMRYTTGAGGKRLLKALRVVNHSKMNEKMAKTLPNFKTAELTGADKSHPAKPHDTIPPPDENFSGALNQDTPENP